ncbi:YecA family protein [Shewanella sp. OPT22]|nr:YecA family protein [Shewanella sp. OPT22]
MVTPPSLRTDKLIAALKAAEISLHPSEVHGAVVGLICGGLGEKADLWLPALTDIISEGRAFPESLLAVVADLHKDAHDRLAEFEFGFTLLLPEEEESLTARVEALSLWVQSFLTSIAIAQPKINKSSEDVKEVVKDLSEISQIELDISEDDESEDAYIALVDYVQDAVAICFAEFMRDGQEDDSEDKPEVLH